MNEQDGKPQALSPGILRLIDVLADELVADYLREEALRNKAQANERSDPGPLPAMNKTA